MDAVKFLKEKKRMCDSYSACTKACLLRKPMDENGVTCLGYCFAHPEDAVAIVEKWSAEHPVKTRQSEFLKMFPNAELSTDGILTILPCLVDKTFSRSAGSIEECYVKNDCIKCKKEYWLAEAEE